MAYGDTRTTDSRGYNRNYNDPRPSYSRPVQSQPSKAVSPALKIHNETVLFRDVRYMIDLLHTHSKIGPAIEIEIKDLHPGWLTFFPASYHDAPKNGVFVPMEQFVSDEAFKHTPVFFKVEGKYGVVLGLKAAKAWYEGGSGKLKGRLLSSVALKRCISE